MRLFLLLLLLCSSLPATEKPQIVHTFVALCDNASQGIVPVPAKIGNGDDPFNNLYWGALYGVKTHFRKSPNWKLLHSEKVTDTILERIVFKHKTKNVYMIADAYRGREIKKCIQRFINAAAGEDKSTYTITIQGEKTELPLGGSANLLSYIGHDGLMEFDLEHSPMPADTTKREAIILACMSRDYFYTYLHQTAAKPLLWTTGFMAPEAYTLADALEGWVRNESDTAIQLRAAQAYNRYQKCGINAAKRLLTTGW